MFKVSEVKEALEEMRKIYAFEDDKTEMDYSHNMQCSRPEGIKIYTVDEKTGVEIMLRKKIESVTV